MHKISIIIPTLNEEDTITKLLADLSKQTSRPHEVLVIDGSSVDTTIKLVKSFRNTQLFVTSPNPAKQRTLGGKQASGELLIFLDADVRIQPDFLQNIHASWVKKPFSIACPYYLPHNASIVIHVIYYFFNSMFFVFQKLSPSGAGSCIIVTKEVFTKVKGFDASFRYDDIAFIRKCARVGKFMMLPFSVIVSPRRFYRDGILQTFGKYVLLSLFFMTNQFKKANIIPYAFNHYNKVTGRHHTTSSR